MDLKVKIELAELGKKQKTQSELKVCNYIRN